jgi:signal transduction histidine kinase
MKCSWRSGLITLWILILIISLGTGIIIFVLFLQGVGAQVRQATTSAEAACAEVSHQYDRYLARVGEKPERLTDDRTKSELLLLLDVIFSKFDAMEGGVWHPQGGFAAYVFPTYQGSTPKRNVPEPEVPRILELVSRVSAMNRPETLQYEGGREAIVWHACPLSVPEHSVVWTMIRVPVNVGAAYQEFLLGEVILSLFALVSGGWLLLLLRRWSGRLRSLENAIVQYPVEQLPQLPKTGEPDLDRIVTALNYLNQRLTTAREQSTTLSKQLAQADRLAALGRMAAELAHEIRNPIATIRLAVENALTKSPERQSLALDVVLQQVQRLDDLMQRLLALVQPLKLRPTPVAVGQWLHNHAKQFDVQARRREISLHVSAPDIEADLDAPTLGRALDNLILNALRHTPAGGEIVISAIPGNEALLLCVEDSGPGVPEADREHIFEPFTSTRTDGVGLGLAIVREVVEAHGGNVRCAAGRAGARFEVELPWHKSWSPTMTEPSVKS